jgi:hypothetical protein
MDNHSFFHRGESDVDAIDLTTWKEREYKSSFRTSSMMGKETITNNGLKGQVLSQDWIQRADGISANELISQLWLECDSYREEAMALREEIEYIKMEILCLRQNIPGRTLPNVMWV